MIVRRIAAVGAIGVFAAALFAQGLNTKASPNDWEEINFEFNSHILSDGYPSLLRLAELLKANPDYRVRVIGHTDYVGSVRYNDKLAQARANTVRDFLVKYGAGANQVTTSGEGKLKPSVSNSTKEGRFINRRVEMVVTDGKGRTVGSGGVGEAINAFDELAKKLAQKQEECCAQILKRLDKLDDILAALRDLKGENDRLKSDLADLRNAQKALQDQVNGMPKPLSEQQTTAIAQAEGNRVLEEARNRNRKFSLLSLNAGPTFGKGRTGDYTISGAGRFFSPFGGDGTHAVQAQAEYMYYTGRQEGQFDIGLVNRWNRVQAGAFASFRYINFREFQSGGALGQGSFTLDYLFSRGKAGFFATKGFKNTATLGRTQIGPSSFLETYARIMNQAGLSGQVGLAGDTWLEGNIAYLQSHGRADRPGGMLRFVAPLSNQFALTAEVGLNETFVNTLQSGRAVFGFQFGNFTRPKEYLNVAHPVPVDVPRIRYELLTRRIGNSPPTADAGPDQVGIPAGTVVLNGSGSSDPEGDALTYQWTQISGPSVAISGANAAIAQFTAADGQAYVFRLTVRDPGGMSSSATTRVATLAPSPVRILRFTADPSTVRPGGVSRLSWAVENADEVTITPGPGRVDSRGGATDVTVQQTTTYRLVARSGDRQVAADVTVVATAAAVAAPQIIRFVATPATINPGEAANLSWTTEGGTQVSISGIGNVEANGSRAVTPSQTTTYTLTVRAADGRQVSAPVIVTVGGGETARVLQFFANPQAINSGGTAQLCWNVEGATEISISPGVGGGLDATGCVTVNPDTTTTYTLTAKSANGRTIQAGTVLVVGGVRVLSFTAIPDFSPKAGDPVTLTWQTEGAVYVVITSSDSPLGRLPANGTLVVRPITNTNYTLTAYGPGGQVSTVLHVFVR
ncbi:MAG: OmpA family protein [Bryobacteraceae bacterium]